jgi:hypothetical protein
MEGAMALKLLRERWGLVALKIWVGLEIVGAAKLIGHWPVTETVIAIAPVEAEQ